jgi:hypothetical protein
MECKGNEMDSVVSGFSQISVGGETISCEKAIDDSCKDIQTTVNELHSYLRLMLMADERGDSYEESLDDYTKLYELIAEGVALLKDLKSIVKQIQPKKPRAATQKAKKEVPLDGCGPC